jgi:hypothetical protein
VADSVEKVRSCEESNFFRGAGAFMEKLCEGPHVHTDFQPARFIARLQGILLPNTGRDGSAASFVSIAFLSFSTESALNRHGDRPLLPASLKVNKATPESAAVRVACNFATIAEFLFTA